MLESIKKEVAWLLKEKYHGKETPEFAADVKRLESGEPLAYIIGWIDFLGCHIDMSHRPLIPRPETEFLIERAIQELRLRENPLRVLDMFSGSGCIGIACAKHLDGAIVDMSEIDANLIQQIQINIVGNNISPAKVRVIASDVFESITEAYDAILANPPYVNPAMREALPKSVIDYEPHRALFAEEEGLKYIRIIIEKGAQYLRHGGICYIECDPRQQTHIERLLEKTSWKHEFWRDQYGKDRFLVLRT